MGELEGKLKKALKSREDRTILRRLPTGTGSLIDFCSNDYLSLASNSHLRSRFLKELGKHKKILGSGGSRLLTDIPGHEALETRLTSFFNAPAALLFNSGFDANAGFFAAVPQAGDVILYDEYIHASVHDGMRSSRARDSAWPFKHNSLASLEHLLRTIIEDRAGVRKGENSVFVAVESLYSMDGDFAPLGEIVSLLDRALPYRNHHLVVDEAHATGLYGENGRGIVSMLGLETRVTARLHTFGKALAGSGAVILTSPLILDYLVNYARPFIYTTALNHASVIGIGCSFDMLEEDAGKELSAQLAYICAHFLRVLQSYLRTSSGSWIYLPEMLWTPENDVASPIIPLITRYPRPLAAYLQKLGFLTRPITYPTVPKGMDRIRICLHAGNTIEGVDGLLAGIMAWADTQRRAESPNVSSKL
ncbi:pyridoxal phosphate-dependent transferase [Gautieria morchelliformis]|nr:pyridoxal phosphate-dependent transferase [Gautieria morchelliformis]